MLNILALALWGFLKEYFSKDFTLDIYGHSMTHGAGPILTLGLLFEETW
jgi:hypothetical protein